MTCAESIQIILEAGTWTSHVSCPQILVLNVDSMRGATNNRITLKDIGESPVYAYNNARIYNEEINCEMEIYSINTTDRDNMYSDIRSIFETSSEKPYIKNPKLKPFRNLYIWNMTIVLNE